MLSAAVAIAARWLVDRLRVWNTATSAELGISKSCPKKRPISASACGHAVKECPIIASSSGRFPLLSGPNEISSLGDSANRGQNGFLLMTRTDSLESISEDERRIMSRLLKMKPEQQKVTPKPQTSKGEAQRRRRERERQQATGA